MCITYTFQKGKKKKKEICRKYEKGLTPLKQKIFKIESSFKLQLISGQKTWTDR